MSFGSVAVKERNTHHRFSKRSSTVDLSQDVLAKSLTTNLELDFYIGIFPRYKPASVIYSWLTTAGTPNVYPIRLLLQPAIVRF